MSPHRKHARARRATVTGINAATKRVDRWPTASSERFSGRHPPNVISGWPNIRRNASHRTPSNAAYVPLRRPQRHDAVVVRALPHGHLAARESMTTRDIGPKGCSLSKEGSPGGVL